MLQHQWRNNSLSTCWSKWKRLLKKKMIPLQTIIIRVFRENERSEIISNLSDEGSLKELILNQIYPQKFRNETSFNAYKRMQENKMNPIR